MMASDITLGMLLEHMQTMKTDLQEQIRGLGNRLTSLTVEMREGFADVRMEMRQGFAGVRQDIRAVQEDLDATIRLQGKHDVQITRLTKRSSK